MSSLHDQKKKSTPKSYAVISDVSDHSLWIGAVCHIVAQTDNPIDMLDFAIV